MGEEPPADGDPHSLTRRGLLALVGTSALAGCQSVGGLSGDSEPTIRAYDLPDIDRDSIPEPVVAPSVPVDIAPSHFTDARDRVSSLLAELPTPFGPGKIPNGHVRQHLTDAADDATDGVDDARTARTDLQALQSLRYARKYARYAAAGWSMASEELSVDSLRRERRQTVADARSFSDGHEYIGTDLVQAALVHARIEDALDRVTGATQPRTRDEGQLLTVAEWGEAAELAQATLDDARHLDGQFTAALPDNVETVDGALTRTGETLLADIRSRRSELPPEPTAEDWGVAERVVSELRREVANGPESEAATNAPAGTVVDATERLAQFRALDRVRDRVEAGEITSVGSAEALREMRTAAYDALETALDESPSPELARTVVSDVSWRVTHADWELGRIERDVAPGRLDDAVEDYVIATAVAGATPEACRQTVDALDRA